MRLPTRVVASRVVEYRGPRLGLLVSVRLLLLTGLLVVGGRALGHPHDRPLADLQQSLARGQVDSLTVEAPPLQGPGLGLEVRWSTGPLHSSIARYNTAAGGQNPVLEAVAASPRPPRVTVVNSADGVDPRHNVGLGFVVGIGLLVLLRYGPAPALATRWAWFWLGSIVPVTVALFLLLERAPLWRPLDPWAVRRPLTGWPALLGALVLAALGRAVLPALTGVFWVRG